MRQRAKLTARIRQTAAPDTHGRSDAGLPTTGRTYYLPARFIFARTARIWVALFALVETQT